MTLGCCYLYLRLPLSVISGGMCMGRDGPRHSLLGVVLMKEKDLLACYKMVMGCYTSSLASLLVQHGLLVRKCQKPFSSPKSFVPSLVRGEVPKENSQSSVWQLTASAPKNEGIDRHPASYEAIYSLKQVDYSLHNLYLYLLICSCIENKYKHHV